MARDYIEVSNDGGTTYRRYDVMLSNEPVIPVPETPSEANATLDGSSVIAYGVSKNKWSLLLRVTRNDTRSNYGTLAQCLGLFSATTAAANNVRFRDREYDTVVTTYQTVITNKTAPDVKCLSPDHLAADAIYNVRLELRQI